MEESIGQKIRKYYKTAAPFHDADMESILADNGRDDVQFYTDLARRLGAPTIEFGCGSGRIGLSLLRKGIVYTGVDIAPAMLESFETKIAAEPEALRARARIKEGDVRATHLDRRFGLAILPGDVLSHVLDGDDRRRALNRVKAHLTPGGVLALDINIPTPAILALGAAGKSKEEEEVERPGEGKGKIVRTAKREFDAGRQIVNIHREWFEVGPRGGRKSVAEADLTLRYIYRYELELLLHHAGFEVVELLGDFDRKPFSGLTGQAVVIAKLRAPVALMTNLRQPAGFRQSSSRPMGLGGGRSGGGGGRPSFQRRPPFQRGGFGGPPRPSYSLGSERSSFERPSYRPMSGGPYGAPGAGSAYGAPPGSPGYAPRPSYPVRDSGTTEFPRPSGSRPARPSFGPPSGAAPSAPPPPPPPPPPAFPDEGSDE